MTLYTEWDGCVRLDDDGDDIGPVVRVYYTANGFHPATQDSLWEPGCYAYFDSIKPTRVELSPRSANLAPLSEAEINAALEWFESDEAQEWVQDEAVKEWLADEPE